MCANRSGNTYVVAVEVVNRGLGKHSVVYLQLVCDLLK